jgi:mRNA interferase MazF
VAWVRLDPTEGHEQAGQRPALVVSFEPFHQAGLLTVLPMTSARTAPRYPGDVAFPAGTAGLAAAGVIICQPRTISARRVQGAPAGYLEDPELRRRVRDSLAHHLSLDLRAVRDGAAGRARYAG